MSEIVIRKKYWLVFILLAAIALVYSGLAVSAAEEVSLTPLNGIPLVILYVNETQSDINEAQAADSKKTYGNIKEMNESKNHSVNAIGDMEIIVPEEYKGEYGSASVPQGRTPLACIRGRGNSTWSAPKKPYRIEYKKKQDLFGMGEAKVWALMANYFDDTLLRNRITYWMGPGTRLKFTPQSIPVDLVMIGYVKDENGKEQEVSREYLGSYCLSETIQVDENRVDIDNLKKDDIDPETITGGYVLGVYSSIQDSEKIAASSWFKTPSGLKFTHDDPEFDNENLSDGRKAQQKYIQDYINELDSLIMESETITPQIHDQIAERMDLESLADYWWIQEFSCNGDAFNTGSTYMYKTRNGKLFWGPLWDFDIAWVLDMGYGPGYVTGLCNTEMNWIDRLREEDSQFAALLKKRWLNEIDGIRKYLCKITEDSPEGILNQYSEEIRKSHVMNQERWMNPDDPETQTDLDTAKENLRFWINKRIEWIDNNIDNVGKVYCTISYENADGDIFTTKSVRDSNALGVGPDAPERAGYIFTGWKEKVTGAEHDGYKVQKDETFVPVYVNEKDAVTASHIYLASYEDYAEYYPGDEVSYWFFDDPVIYPKNATDQRIKWTSSDESILSFIGPGTSILKGTGDVDVTVALSSGPSAILHLHVLDLQKEGIQPVDAEDMKFEPSEYTIKPGETIQVLPTYLPKGKYLTKNFCSYKTDNELVVEIVDAKAGVITGLKPGKATINVTARDLDWEDTFSASFQVTVTDGKVTPDEPDKPVAPTPVDISKARVILSKTAFTYNGKVQKPVIKTIGGKKLAEGKDYTLKWSDASSKKVGPYTLTITGKGNYTGIVKSSYNINPKGTKLTKLKKEGKALRVRWKKQAGKMSSSRITGYQLQLATNKKFTKNKKSLTVKGYKKVSKKVTGLKGGKKYYVRIRTYKTIKGKRYYSPWSKIKTK